MYDSYPPPKKKKTPYFYTKLYIAVSIKSFRPQEWFNKIKNTTKGVLFPFCQRNMFVLRL